MRNFDQARTLNEDTLAALCIASSELCCAASRAPFQSSCQVATRFGFEGLVRCTAWSECYGQSHIIFLLLFFQLPLRAHNLAGARGKDDTGSATTFDGLCWFCSPSRTGFYSHALQSTALFTRIAKANKELSTTRFASNLPNFSLPQYNQRLTLANGNHLGYSMIGPIDAKKTVFLIHGNPSSRLEIADWLDSRHARFPRYLY